MFLLTGPNIVCRFIVHGGSPGLKISKIENKMSLRVVQNCNIQLDNVFVPDDDRFPGANCFQDLVDVRNKILLVDGVNRCPAYIYDQLIENPQLEIQVK
jgi:hypothetical protein